MYELYDKDSLREYRNTLKDQNRRVALVPTMGALHEGHASLITHAHTLADEVIVSIFLNPLQFGPNEDFKRYPKPLDDDKQYCKDLAVSALFLPSNDIIYPPDAVFTDVTVPSLSSLYCGQSRPNFFSGVTNVVLRLLNLINPDSVIFGEKDYQQYIIIKSCIESLFLSTKIYCSPIIRNQQGLALSSRNRYLSNQDRHDAASIFQSLCKVKDAVQSGILDATELTSVLKKSLSPNITIDYIAFVDEKSLVPVTTIRSGNRVLFAGNLNKTRLIDTFELTFS